MLKNSQIDNLHLVEESGFKFGQLLERDDICDREDEISLLLKIARQGGRAVVYGPRRYGKTSVVKNAVMADFLAANKKSLAIYCDVFQVESIGDFTKRLHAALELTLSHKAKIKTFFGQLQSYIKNFKIELAADPLSGMPSISLAGQHVREDKSLAQLLEIVAEFSKDHKTLLIFDEFQDVAEIATLEAKLRNELQALSRTSIILLGSKQHVLNEIFHNERRPFYGFGVDVEFLPIPLAKWVPYIQKRFSTRRIKVKKEEVAEICRLMNNVPNSIQEFCHWIALKNTNLTELDSAKIHSSLADLIDNKASRYLERLGQFSVKEKRVLVALAKMEPVTSIAATEFLQTTKVSATATRATIKRFTDYGVLNQGPKGYTLTDPLFRHYLVYRYR